MDESDETRLASAGGIVRCLRMLAEEARSLGLQRTAELVEQAVLACQTEMALLGGLAGLHTVPRTLN